MIIDQLSYQPVTLRKNRKQSFLTDLAKAYDCFLKTPHPKYNISIKNFNKEVMQISQVKYLNKCIREQQDPQQFHQLLQITIIDYYFRGKDKLSKIFALLTLYFVYYFSDPRIKIVAGSCFIQELNEFLKQNIEDGKANLDYFKILPDLMQNFIYTAKSGVQTHKMFTSNQKQIKQQSDQLCFLENLTLSQQIVQTESHLDYYEHLKRQQRQLLQQCEDKFNHTDRYFSTRLKNLLANYTNQRKLK